MQTYLADIQKLLSDWYLLTIDNPWYGFTTAAIVWLLVALFYNFKIFLLNKKKTTVEQQLSETQTKLEETELQLMKNEETITVNTDQLVEHKQVIEKNEEKNKNRNQKIIDSTKALAAKFDLKEPVNESGDEKQDEFIWQQQDSVIEQLSERIAIEQQEKNALEATHRQELEKISDLQTMLDTQEQKFSQMLTEQKSTLAQQNKEAQKHLSNMLESQGDISTAVPEDELIPDLIGSISFDKEEEGESLNIKSLFDSEKTEGSITPSIDTVGSEKSVEVVETEIQGHDLPIQEEPSAILSEEQDAEKEKNFQELKKLLGESKQDKKTKMTSTLEKKPVVTPRKKKKVTAKSKSSFTVPNFNIVKKVKGLFSKD